MSPKEGETTWPRSLRAFSERGLGLRATAGREPRTLQGGVESIEARRAIG